MNRKRHCCRMTAPPPAAAPPRSSRRRQSEGQVEVLSAKEAKRTRPTECQASGSARINGGAGSSGMALPPPSAPPAPTEAGPSAAGPSVVDNIKQQFTCPICQDLVVAAHAMVPCGHCFCGGCSSAASSWFCCLSDCLKGFVCSSWSSEQYHHSSLCVGACLSAWLGQGKRDCPNCRKETTAPPVRQNAIDNAVEAIAGQLTAEEKEAMKEKKEEWETGKGRFERLLQAAADRPAFLPGVANRFALAMGGVLSGPLAASWAMPSRSYALGPASLPASARPVGQTGSRHDIQWQAHVGYVRNSPGREVVVCCGCHQAMNAGQVRLRIMGRGPRTESWHVQCVPSYIWSDCRARRNGIPGQEDLRQQDWRMVRSLFR